MTDKEKVLETERLRHSIIKKIATYYDVCKKACYTSDYVKALNFHTRAQTLTSVLLDLNEILLEREPK